MASMRDLNGKIRMAKGYIDEVQKLADELTNNDPYGEDSLGKYQRDPHLVLAEVTSLRATTNRQAMEIRRLQQELASAKKPRYAVNNEGLRASRDRVRQILKAGPVERTFEAATRVVEENKRVQAENTRLSVRLSLAERMVGKGTPRDQAALKALRESRKDVRAVLGAKRGESTLDAAKRIVERNGW